jgi:hypothetical protein
MFVGKTRHSRNNGFTASRYTEREVVGENRPLHSSSCLVPVTCATWIYRQLSAFKPSWGGRRLLMRTASANPKQPAMSTPPPIKRNRLTLASLSERAFPLARTT